MKAILLLLSVLLFQFVYANPQPYPDKNKPYDFKLLGEAGSYLSKANRNFNKNIDSSYYYIQQAECIIDSTSELERTVLYLAKSIYGFYSSADNDETIEISKQGLQLSQKNGFTFYELKFHLMLAFLYKTNSSESLYHNLKTLEVSKKMNNTHQTITTLVNLSLYEIQSHDYNQARVYLKELRPLLKGKDVRPSFKVKYYINQSRVSSELHQAQNHLDSALYFAQKHNLDQLIITTYATKAKSYNEFKESEMAIAYYEKTDSLTYALGQPKITGQYNLARAKLYLDVKDFKRAKKFHSLHMKSKYSKAEFSNEGALKIGYRIYKNLGETEKSLDYLEKYLDEYIEDTDKRRDSLFVEYENRYKLYDLEMEAKLKSKDLANTKLISKITSTGLILIIILTVLIFIQKNKKNRIKLSLTNDLLNKEKELHAFRQEALENIVSEIKNPLTILKGIISFLSSEFNHNNYSKILEFGSTNTEHLQHNVEGIIGIFKSTPDIKSLDKKPSKLLPIFTNLIYNLNALYKNKNIQILIVHNLQNSSYAYIESKAFKSIFKIFVTEILNISTQNCTITIDLLASNNDIKINLESSGITNLKQAESIYEIYNENPEILHHKKPLPIHTYINTLNTNIHISSESNTSSIILTYSIPYSCYDFLDRQNIIEISQFTNQDKNNSDIIKAPKVLIIDPDLLMAKFYTLILSNAFDIDFIPDKDQAVKMLNTKKYDCILSDILFETNNAELSTYINQLTLNRTIPIIIVTSKSIEEIRITAYESGIHDFITKPFIVREFITRIQNVIKNNKIRLSHIHKQVNPESDTEYDSSLLERILNNIDKNLSKPDFNIEELAESVFYSKRQLTRITTRLTGLPPAKLILERRLLKAYNILKEHPEMRISEIQNVIGIKSPSYFIKTFKARFGITPGSIKNNS